MEMRKNGRAAEPLFLGLTSAAAVALVVFLGGNIGTKKLLAFCGVSIAAFFLHLRRRKSRPAYLKELLGISGGKRRTFEYDWLRMMAVSMVIVTHGIQGDMDSGKLAAEGGVWYAMTVVYVVCLVCNLIYVMLSGALLFGYREESLADFYTRRISRILLPMVVYFVFYVSMSGGLTHVSAEKLGDMALRLVSGQTPECPHYWLMYVILEIYVLIPFLRQMFRNMPYGTLTFLVVLSWLFMTAFVYFPVRAFLNPYLASWLGVAVTGYWLGRRETRSYDRYLMAAGLLGLGVTMYIINAVRGKDEIFRLCCNFAPTMVLMACGLFAAVFSFPKVFSKGNALLSMLSQYSYSTILVHWVILFALTEDRLGIDTSQYGYVGGTALTLLVTLALSFVYAFAIDNTVLLVVETAYDGAVRGIRGLCGRRKKQLS